MKICYNLSMNLPKCNEIDYINFWIATQKNYSCLEAEKVHPQEDNSPAHDSLTRLLQRNEPDTSKLFNESKTIGPPTTLKWMN